MDRREEADCLPSAQSAEIALPLGARHTLLEKNVKLLVFETCKIRGPKFAGTVRLP